MKNVLSFGILAGAALAGAAIWVYQSKKNSPLMLNLKKKAMDASNKIADYGKHLKKTLMPDRQGPNGEMIYLDMYDRLFYEDPTGKRVYLEA